MYIYIIYVEYIETKTRNKTKQKPRDDCRIEIKGEEWEVGHKETQSCVVEDYECSFGRYG